jgi:hypothetical protein
VRDRILRLTAALAAAFALTLGASAAAADSPSFEDPGDALAGHPGMTELDLLKIAVPNMALNPTSHKFEGSLDDSPRHVVSDQNQYDLPDTLVPAAMQDVRIKVGGKPRIALLADFEPQGDQIESATVLMLFDDSAKPKLLDMVEVGVDKDTAFADHTVLSLGAGDDALITYSAHSDSDMTLGAYLLILPAGDHLQLVDMLSVDGENGCGWSNIESAAFATRPDPGRRYGQIDVAVRSDFTHSKKEEADCGASEVRKGNSATFRWTYRWNAAAAKFDAEGDGLKKLEALNHAEFE